MTPRIPMSGWMLFIVGTDLTGRALLAFPRDFQAVQSELSGVCLLAQTDAHVGLGKDT